MANELQLTYGGIALHSLGNVSVVSQQGQFSPDEFPQVETRTIHVRITTWAQDTGFNYDTLYANIKALREACQAQNKILKWQSAGDTALGEIQLQRPAMVVSHDIPEDLNAIGSYGQQINITFRFEVDTSTDSTLLTATVTGTGVSPTVVSLGKVHKWKDEYRNNFYSEWQNIRQRSTGMLSCSGEIRKDVGETGVTTDTRLASALVDLTALKNQLQAGRYITLKYGPSADGSLFNKAVKIETFTADVDQGPYTGVIKWSLSCSYTLFPNEASYAGSEFSATASQDKESAREILSVVGNVKAATEALAVSKLAVIEAAMQTAYGFTAAQQTRKDITKAWVNANDTQGLNTTQNGTAVSNTSFIELSFNLGYEKKITGVTSYTLTVSDVDDLETGLITRTYAGSVTTSGNSEDAAYAAALAQARTLGDKKHNFRVSKSESRADRKLTTGSLEFVRVDFSYSYRLKGERMFMSVTSSTSADTFGETQERVTGYVVAKDLTTAQEHYTNTVKKPYTDANRLIRNETTDLRTDYVELGTTWTAAASGTATLPIRLDFSLSVFKPKTANTFGVKYVVNVVPDYLSLLQTTTVEGVFVGAADYLAAIEADTDNPLKTFIANIGTTYGNLVRKGLNYDKELVSSTVLADAETISIRFNLEYQKSITTSAQILRCTLREDTTYSGTRWVTQDTPDDTVASVIQNCGKTVGSRTVSGTITAATEAAALAWAQTQHGANGLWENWRSGETKPADADRYEQPMRISISYDFAPLTDGSARGDGKNIQVVNLDFTYTELVPDLPAPF